MEKIKTNKIYPETTNYILHFIKVRFNSNLSFIYHLHIKQ
jgi:hypothetical protein